MALLKYIKSFSKGQITIPKEFRDALNLGDEFWLMLTTKNGGLLAEPVKNNTAQVNKSTWRKTLLSLETYWFGPNEEKEIKKNRIKTEKRLANNAI